MLDQMKKEYQNELSNDIQNNSEIKYNEHKKIINTFFF